MKNKDTAITKDTMGATLIKGGAVQDELGYDGQFLFKCVAPVEERREEFIGLRDKAEALATYGQQLFDQRSRLKASNFIVRWWNKGKIVLLNRRLDFTEKAHRHLVGLMDSIPKYTKWEDSFENLITTVGKNAMLDNHFAGSGYTAAWYMGLIDNASFTAVAAADTMSSHAGWIESAAYSQATRVASAWSAASAGAKALSAALAFSINGTVTLNGGFLCSVSTKSGTTGILNNAGSFTGGTRACINGDTVNVSYSATLT